MDMKAYYDLAIAFNEAKGEPGIRLTEAIKAAFGTAEDHGDEIAALCEAQGIIVPKAFREHSAQAKRGAVTDKIRETMKAEAGKAQEILDQVEKNLEAGADPADPAIEKALDDVRGHLAAVSQPRKAGGLTPENLHDFGTSEGFPVAFWNGLKIPTPGATIIGAKTGGGKTSALVNIARELLEQGRRVCIISYEMNAQEIGLALTLSFMARRCTKPIPNFSKDMESSGEYFPIPLDESIRGTEEEMFSDYFSDLKAYITKHGTPDYLKNADSLVSDLLRSGHLAILDAVGDADALARYIEGTNFDAYFVDYIQAITPGKNAPAEGFRRVGATVDKIRAIVNQGKKTLILGAQFNREKGEGVVTSNRDTTHFDPASDQFREAADIEQLATMAIGIGWQKDKDGAKTFFWKVLKHRFNGSIRDVRMVSTGEFRYYLNQRGGPWIRPEKWEWKTNDDPKTEKEKQMITYTNSKERKPVNKGEYL